MCDYIAREKSTYRTIYIGGYYMRTLVDGYEIFGDRRYLDVAVAYSDYLLKGANAGSRGQTSAFNTVTSLTGRAVADIISPGVDSRW
ncbi:MAG: hypothetical protein ACRD3O_06320 [Terriglobia bacterium]